MGSWTDLDANYPPGRLTPATALIVALGHVVGATSVYAEGAVGPPASFIPINQLGAAPDLLARAELYLQDVPVETFLAEASALLWPRQRLCIVLNLCDQLLMKGLSHPEKHPFVARSLVAFDIIDEQLQPHLQTLRLKNDLEMFPQ